VVVAELCEPGALPRVPTAASGASVAPAAPERSPARVPKPPAAVEVAKAWLAALRAPERVPTPVTGASVPGLAPLLALEREPAGAGTGVPELDPEPDPDRVPTVPAEVLAEFAPLCADERVPTLDAGASDTAGAPARSPARVPNPPQTGELEAVAAPERAPDR